MTTPVWIFQIMSLRCYTCNFSPTYKLYHRTSIKRKRQRSQEAEEWGETLFYSHVVQWGEVRRRWLWMRRRRRRRKLDLLASVGAEGKMVAERDVGTTEGGSRRCRHGYCWEGWVGAGEHRLQKRRVLNECCCFKQDFLSYLNQSTCGIWNYFIHVRYMFLWYTTGHKKIGPLKKQCVLVNVMTVMKEAWVYWGYSRPEFCLSGSNGPQALSSA